MLLQRITLVLTITLALSACDTGEQPQTSGDDASVAPSATGEQPAANQPDPSPTAAERGPAEPASTAALPDGPLYTVQIASYEESGEASQLQSFLTQQGMPVWTTIAEVNGRTYHRVRIGALQDLDAMRRLGRDLASRYNADVWIAPVEARDAVPADAIDATRALVPSP